MKKIIVALLLVISLMSFQQAGAQQLKFYYYPKSNVYYDVANHQYIYLHNGTWTTVTSLPSGMTATGRRVIVRHSGPEVWTQNSMHVKRYGVNYPKGKAVGWHGRNPNRAKGRYKH
jgi:hypothetical protein